MQLLIGQYHEHIVVIGQVLKRLLGAFSHTQNALGPVVEKVDNAIWINLYRLDSAIGFRHTYSLDSHLSNGKCYPTFEQPGPGGSNSFIS